MKIKRPKGTNDIFGRESYKWQFLENEIRQTCKIFGIQEIRTPIFEYKNLFERGVGETTVLILVRFMKWKK